VSVGGSITKVDFYSQIRGKASPFFVSILTTVKLVADFNKKTTRLTVGVNTLSRLEAPQRLPTTGLERPITIERSKSFELGTSRRLMVW
jgi:hypothetical protein